MADIIILTAIFGYAAFALYRGFKKSKKAPAPPARSRSPVLQLAGSTRRPLRHLRPKALKINL